MDLIGIEARSEKVPIAGCWIWMRYTCKKGYGQVHHSGKVDGAHRVAYMLKHGDIPAGLHVLHRCDVPGCVNPDHLYLGTNDDNMLDKAKKNRSARFFGLSNPRGKLSDQQVLAIRSDPREGMVIAMEYGVKRDTVYAIKNNRRHRNLSCHA